ncbi:MAG: NAD(P)H-hydrate dehydratase [Hyphomicrobiales bacterium]|nr:NAD(P)H-hydrate dehydratase [Hyphomicrobiales bacterium]
MVGDSLIPPENALLSIAESRQADAYAIEAGISGLELMESAGKSVADAIKARWAPCPVAVLCGPGNNGGDGFVVARLLADDGWPVRLGFVGRTENLPDDARAHAERWRGATEELAPSILDGAELAVDALFGAGLTRDLDGVILDIINLINERDGLPCVAVDVPSGVHGDDGTILGAAPQCELTVTFFRRKPGHLLLPGRLLCGEVVVADIGIPQSALESIKPRTTANAPALWSPHLRRPRLDDNKYRRGHAVIRGGGELTGAARLAARAAFRAGAGLVTITCPAEAFPIYAGAMTTVMVKPVTENGEFAAFLDDPRKTAILVGPGNGVDLATRAAVKAALATRRACVLDADALTVFADSPPELFSAVRGPAVLTPHDGEYERLFSHQGSRLVRARAAARQTGAVVLVKGADTVVAAPDGRAAIIENAPAFLATAGAGDVLSGVILGLLAQGMAPFEAAAAGAWLHAEAANDIGFGLIAEDLPDQLPKVVGRLIHGA